MFAIHGKKILIATAIATIAASANFAASGPAHACMSCGGHQGGHRSPPTLNLRPNLPPVVRAPSRPQSDADNDMILIGPDGREDPEFTFGEVPTYMQTRYENGNTTTVTSFPDGSRRVTTLDADGNIVSNHTTGPRGSNYPSATSTHGDGSVHTAQGNYPGDHDVTHSSADGSTAGAENHSAGHDSNPSATIHNPDGSSATSTGDANGNRAVGGTDATGNAATTTVGQSDSMTNTNPDGSSSTVVGTSQGHAVTDTNAQGDSSTTVHDSSHNNAPSATLHNPDGSSATSAGNAAGGHTVSGTDAFGNTASANW